MKLFVYICTAKVTRIIEITLTFIDFFYYKCQ